MNKKITFVAAAGVITGITIYLVSQVLKEKSSCAGNDKGLSTELKGIYPYEYSL